MRPVFGTLEWGKKNNGVLTRTERLHFLRNMAFLAARDRLVGPGSGRRLQATDAVGRLHRVAAGADRLGAVYAAGSGGGAGRARDQDPSEGRVGVRSRRGLELQKKRHCSRSRRALTWRESVRGGKPIRGGSTPPAWCSSTRP